MVIDDQTRISRCGGTLFSIRSGSSIGLENLLVGSKNDPTEATVLLCYRKSSCESGCDQAETLTKKLR